MPSVDTSKRRCRAVPCIGRRTARNLSEPRTEFNRRLYSDNSRLFQLLMERLFRAAGVDQADGVFHVLNGGIAADRHAGEAGAVLGEEGLIVGIGIAQVEMVDHAALIAGCGGLRQEQLRCEKVFRRSGRLCRESPLIMGLMLPESQHQGVPLSWESWNKCPDRNHEQASVSH